MKILTFNQIIVVGIFATVFSSVFGCASQRSVAENSGNKPEVTQTDSQSTEDTMEPVAFTNEDGKLVCPVMGTVIASKDDAVGHIDHDGKRYYFCCGGCPDEFKADPKKYAEGANL